MLRRFHQLALPLVEVTQPEGAVDAQFATAIQELQIDLFSLVESAGGNALGGIALGIVLREGQPMGEEDKKKTGEVYQLKFKNSLGDVVTIKQFKDKVVFHFSKME